MAVAIKMPDLGTTVDTMTLTVWLADVGDYINRGDPLAEVLTDKANTQIESVADGILLRKAVSENATVSSGEIIAYIGAEDELVQAPGKPLSMPPKETTEKKKSADPEPITKKAPAKISMFTRNLARGHGVDPASVKGSGEGGAVTREDIQRAVGMLKNSAPAPRSDAAFKLGLYRQMVLIRHFEERVKYLFLEGIMPGTIHQYQGEEAVAVGACAALNRDDIITSTHRPHGHAIAKGVSIGSLLAELFGKSTGCCGGKGGSMHVGDINQGMIPAIAIVGGNVPLATGCALAFKMRGESRVALSFMGDGAINEGAFHEAVNMGAIWSLPVVYVIENNRYSASTPIASTVKLPKLSDRAAGYGLPGVTIDGNDVMEVYSACHEAAARAREGKGPTLIEAVTYRITGHSRRDPCNYQPETERQEALEREPIGRFAKQLLSEKIATQAQLDTIAKEVDQEIEAAVEAAKEGPDPMPEDALLDMFV